MKTGSAHAELCSGLSRMKGNFHVRFLGEGVAAMPLPYPTGQSSDRRGLWRNGGAQGTACPTEQRRRARSDAPYHFYFR